MTGNDHSAVCVVCKSVQWCSKMVGKNPVLSGLHAQGDKWYVVSCVRLREIWHRDYPEADAKDYQRAERYLHHLRHRLQPYLQSSTAKMQIGKEAD